MDETKREMCFPPTRGYSRPYDPSKAYSYGHREPAPPPGADSDQCQICQLPFSPTPSNGPLNRACVFCHRVSARADTTRRHEKTCGARHHPYTREYKKGRKTKACDSCARVKVACDAKKPCQRCAARNVECTYGRMCSILWHRVPRSWAKIGRETAAEDKRVADAVIYEKRRTTSPFPFLLSCTDPQINFVKDVMVRDEPERDPAQSQTPAPAFDIPPAPPPVLETFDTIDPQLLFRGFMDPYLGLSLDDGSMDGSVFNIGTENIDDSFSTVLAPRSWTTGLGTTAKNSLKPRVIELETEMLQMIAKNDPDTAEKHYETVRAFFKLAEFHRLFAIFFRRQQLLAKMIHWPTFDARCNEVGLMLAIALCGVAYSKSSPTIARSLWLPEGDTTDSAQLLAAAAKIQPLAEKFIFDRLEQVVDAIDDHGVVPSNGDHNIPLQACQAAYLIVLLQISVNDNKNKSIKEKKNEDNTKTSETRHRAMTIRQPALVEAIRRLGMMNKVNKSHSAPLPVPHDHLTYQQSEVWRNFAYNESCTRLALWAMFTDGLLALFCNRPPTMSMSEMLGDLPCSDELWEAPTADAYDKVRQRISAASPQQQKPRVNLKSVMAGLMSDNDNMYTAVCADLTVFHLYAVVGALQFAVFSCRAQSLLDSMGPKLVKALDRWEKLWDAALGRVPDDEQRWLGVAKHSPEFARIARRIVHASMVVSSTAEVSSMPAFPSADVMDNLRRSEYMQCRPEFDLGVFHQFILEFGGDDWPAI